MQNEILKPVLATDETAIPRYDIVNPDGSVSQQNVELRLKNEVMQQGTPYDEESVLPATLREKLGIPNSATPANAFEAVLAKAGAKVSMNEPTSQDNIAAGYSIGAMWIRPSYTLYNLAYSKLAEDFTASACLVSKYGKSVTATGTGDDKVISVALEHGSNTGWLYCVVTPDATAVSAKLIAGTEEFSLTIGKANVVKHKYSSTSVTFEATYATANEAKTGTIVIDNLTVIDETETLEQVDDGYRDVTDNTVYDFVSKHALLHRFIVDSASWKHIHDGKWTSFDAILPQIIVTALTGSTVTCTKGETILTAQEINETWVFNLTEYGEYIVSWVSSYGTKKETILVLVDSVKQYIFDFKQEIHYLMLYDNGDSFIDVTGGWYNGETSRTEWTARVTEQGIYEKYMYGAMTKGAATIAFMTAKSVDFSKYPVFGIDGFGSQAKFGKSSDPYNTNQDWRGKVDNAGADLSTSRKLNLYTNTDGATAYPFIGGVDATSGRTQVMITFYHAFVAENDDWSGMCAKAGVDVPSSLSDLLSDSGKLTTILSSYAAVEHMIYICTGSFMVNAVLSSTFLTALNSSPYKEKVYANEHWAKFLAMVA